MTSANSNLPLAYWRSGEAAGGGEQKRGGTQPSIPDASTICKRSREEAPSHRTISSLCSRGMACQWQRIELVNALLSPIRQDTVFLNGDLHDGAARGWLCSQLA